MPVISSRTACRARVCMRSPPRAGSDSTELDVGRLPEPAGRCRPRHEGGVRSGRRRGPSWRSPEPAPPAVPGRCRRPRTPTVNGSLSTSISQPLRCSPSGGARSSIVRAIAVGFAGSAIRPMCIGIISAWSPRDSARTGVDVAGYLWTTRQAARRTRFPLHAAGTAHLQRHRGRRHRNGRVRAGQSTWRRGRQACAPR